MSKIVCIMGKSSTGKDTIFKELLKDSSLGLKKLVPYTTRPKRAGEKEGAEYYFTNEEGYQKLWNEKKIIEERSYQTFHGLWRYFTVDDGKIFPEKENYIFIGTPDAYKKLQKNFGCERLLPVLIELDDGVRLQRALNREKKQNQPRYEELCRRFLADSEDFKQEVIQEIGVTKSFYNGNFRHCLAEIKEYIKKNL